MARKKSYEPTAVGHFTGKLERYGDSNGRTKRSLRNRILVYDPNAPDSPIMLRITERQAARLERAMTPPKKNQKIVRAS